MNKSLKPWIVPKEKLQEFCRKARSGDGHYYVESILKHDDDNYCVVTSGSYPFIEDQWLKPLLENER